MKFIQLVYPPINIENLLQEEFTEYTLMCFFFFFLIGLFLY